MTGQAKLIGIARKAKSRAPMETLEQITCSTALGVDGDYRGKLRKRQVTILSNEDWQTACAVIDRTDLPWTTRRANLLVSGIPLPRDIGAKISIGSVVFEITGETDPCRRMEDAAKGLEEALRPDWRGGVTCRVIKDGTIQCGDAVQITSMAD